MTTQNTAGISPNLLMNFNPYDILEPERNPKVDRLIDIGDVPSTAEVDASLLDQKKRYDLIDLYQNMYVTPEHIKKNDEAKTEVAASNSIDFNDFFDKIESGEKIDWTVNTMKTKLHADNVELVRKPRVLIPKLNTTEGTRNGSIASVKKSKTTLDNDSDSDEDLIEELLAKKNIEKRILDELKKRNSTPILKEGKNDTKDTDISRSKMPSTPSDTIDFSRIKVLNAPTDLNFKDAAVTKANTNRNNTKPIEEDFDIAAELSRLKLNNIPKENTEKLKLQSPGIKIEGQINNTQNFTLIPIKKDEKVYRKKRIEKPKSQTCNFTKGADFYEKSVVLPQIMQRIKERQHYLQERNNLNRRLILDGGVKNSTDIKKSDLNEDVINKSNVPTSRNNVAKSPGTTKSNTNVNTDDTWGKVNPISLMADCNKERLKAFEQGRMFQNFVMNGK